MKATNVRGAKYSPEKMLDSEKTTYFAGKDGEAKADITFTLPKAIEFDCLMIEEVIELGHRTTKWSVETLLMAKTGSPFRGDGQADHWS